MKMYRQIARFFHDIGLNQESYNDDKTILETRKLPVYARPNHLLFGHAYDNKVGNTIAKKKYRLPYLRLIFFIPLWITGVLINFQQKYLPSFPVIFLPIKIVFYLVHFLLAAILLPTHYLVQQALLISIHHPVVIAATLVLSLAFILPLFSVALPFISPTLTTAFSIAITSIATAIHSIIPAISITALIASTKVVFATAIVGTIASINYGISKIASWIYTTTHLSALTRQITLQSTDLRKTFNIIDDPFHLDSKQRNHGTYLYLKKLVVLAKHVQNPMIKRFCKNILKPNGEKCTFTQTEYHLISTFITRAKQLQYTNICEPWEHLVTAFLESRASFNTGEELIQEIRLRTAALEKLDAFVTEKNHDAIVTIKGITKKHYLKARHVLLGYPHHLQDNRKLHDLVVNLPEQLLDKKNSPQEADAQWHNSYNRLNCHLALNLNNELKIKVKLFKTARKSLLALINKDATIEKHGRQLNRNPIYVVNNGKKSIIIKVENDAARKQNEIASREMAELARLDKQMLPSLVQHATVANYDEQGNFKHHSVIPVLDAAEKTVIIKTFIDCRSDTDSYESKSAIRNTIEQFDLLSFQKSIIIAYLLGASDFLPDKSLFKKSDNTHKISGLQNIMPENNFFADIPLPHIIDGKLLKQTNKLYQVKFEYHLLRNAFPLSCWLLGLPQAKENVDKELVAELLTSLDISRFKAYHNNKKLYTPKQINAQYERITYLREKLLSFQNNRIENFTPIDLYEHFYKRHPAFNYLKQQKLPDLLLYTQLSRIPKGLHHLLTQYAEYKLQSTNKYTDEDVEIKSLKINESSRRLLFFSEAYHLMQVDKLKQTAEIMRTQSEFKSIASVSVY